LESLSHGGNINSVRSKYIQSFKIEHLVDLILEKGQIVIRPVSEPRKGWEDAFKEMADKGDDRLLFNDDFKDENLEESRIVLNSLE